MRLAWLFACPKCPEHCRRRWRSVAEGSNLLLPVSLQVLDFPRLSRKMLYGWWRDRDEGRWAGHSCQCNLTKTSNLPPAVLPRWNKPSGDVFLQPASRLLGCSNSISKAFLYCPQNRPTNSGSVTNCNSLLCTGRTTIQTELTLIALRLAFSQGRTYSVVHKRTDKTNCIIMKIFPRTSSLGAGVMKGGANKCGLYNNPRNFIPLKLLTRLVRSVSINGNVFITISV